MKKPIKHNSKLCCIVSSIGKMNGRSICRQCLKDIINTDKKFKDIMLILEQFTLHEKN